MEQKEETKEKRNIVFFDLLAKKDLHTPVTLSLKFQHEVGVETFLPDEIKRACEVSEIKGTPCNLRFYDLGEKKKLTIKDVSQFPSGELTEATEEEIKKCEKKLSEFNIL